jgi:hypothetical protein
MMQRWLHFRCYDNAFTHEFHDVPAEADAIQGGDVRSHACQLAGLNNIYGFCCAVQGFLGCKHFSAANKLLIKSGLPAIDWQIEEV